MNRYSEIHEAGVRPPANALDAQSWKDLVPSSPGYTAFSVTNGDQKPRVVMCSSHLTQTMRTLIERPLYAASRCRLSHYVSELRSAGVLIDTIGYRNDDETGRRLFGVWFLRSKVSEVPK